MDGSPAGLVAICLSVATTRRVCAGVSIGGEPTERPNSFPEMKPMTENYYEILRVAPDADAETIRSAYRKMAQIYHPDKRANKKFANHKFKLIGEAYAVLSDPDKRSEYDQTIGASKENETKQASEEFACRFSETFGDDAGAHCYRNGERHWMWEMRYEDGRVDVGEFVDGERNGKWEERFADGDVYKGPYVDGERHGLWKIRRANGGVEVGHFVNGKLDGQWDERFADGAVFRGDYVKGKKHGFWKERFADGSVQFASYEKGQGKETWKVPFDNEAGKEPKSESAIDWEMVVFCVVAGYWIRVAVEYFWG